VSSSIYGLFFNCAELASTGSIHVWPHAKHWKESVLLVRLVNCSQRALEAEHRGHAGASTFVSCVGTGFAIGRSA